MLNESDRFAFHQGYGASHNFPLRSPFAYDFALLSFRPLERTA
jgi:hypothetical protein